MTIIDFCDRHNACRNGRDWALSTGCATMSELWELGMHPEWRLWIAARPGVLSDRDLRLFACSCVRQVWHLLEDERSLNAVEVLERYTSGEATAEELVAAYPAAYAAADAADAAYVAARAAAARAAADASYAAARAAAYVAANAAYAAARAADAACDAGGYAAARAAQADYLIALGNPFKGMTK